MPHSVPLIDISAFYQRDRDPQAMQQLQRQVDRTLCETGFLCVRGTPVPGEEVKRAQAVATAFFDLPQARKGLAHTPAQSVRGYTGLGELGLSYSMDAEDLRSDKKKAPPDLFERYRIGPVDRFPEPYQTLYAQGAYARNVWPTGASEFEEVLTDYYRKMNALSQDLLRIFALTLGLNEQWFEDKVNRSMGSLAINHYPAPEKPPLPGQLRAGPHTDYGTLTIVAPTAAPGGLEIRTKSGTWEPVAVESGTFVVNIGDMMAQWSNDRWVSTVHRVVNAQAGERELSRRLSLVFFHQPNPDALIECIPTCVGMGEAGKYPPVNAGEYISAKINRHFKSYLAA